jgi:hypothetical protein
MPLSHSLVTLNQTAQMLTLTSAQEGTYGREVTIAIQNLHSSHYVFLGDSTVTTSSYGFRIDPDQTFTATLNVDDELYAVTDTGTTNIATIRILHNA